MPNLDEEMELELDPKEKKKAEKERRKKEKLQEKQQKELMADMDEEETAYLFQSKYELILENNMHSSGFATKEEANLIEA